MTEQEAKVLTKEAGKEGFDLIQAFVDPEKTKGKVQEMQEAALKLWNLQRLFKETKPKAIAFHVVLGMLEDAGTDYFPLIVAPTTP